MSKKLRVLLYVLRRQRREIFFSETDDHKVTGNIVIEIA